MDKARAVVISLSVVAAWVFLPSPAAAWFSEARLYSDLQWSPDGARIFYESWVEYEGMDGGANGAAVYYFDLATGEDVCVVPGAICVKPAAAGGPIEIKELYGFELCSLEAGLNPDVYRVGPRRETSDALYISEDFTEYIFEEYDVASGGCDVVLKDLRTGSRRVLAEDTHGDTVYLKKSRGLVYTVEEWDEISRRPFPVSYLLDLKTGRERQLGTFYLLGVTADERRATVWRSPGGRWYDDDRSVMSISLAAEEPEAKKLLVGPVRTYDLSPGGAKLVYEEGGRLKVVDSTTGESADLPKGACAWAWSPDDRYLVFQLNGDIPSGSPICVVDTDAREFVLSSIGPPYPDFHVDFFYWSPSARYVVLDSKAAGGNLHLVDVEAGEGWSVQEGEAAFFCWVGESTIFYSSGGKLYSYDCEKREGRVVCEPFPEEGDYFITTWINDSQLIYVEMGGYGHDLLLDVRTGASRVLAPGSASDFFFAEDGDLVFRTGGMPPGYPDYWEFDFATGYAAPYEGAVEDVARRSRARGDVVVPSPDGGRVAVLEGGKLTLRDADGGNAVTLMERGKGVNVGELAEAEPKGPVWSPAGDKVAWLREGFYCGPFTDIWVADRDGGDVRMLLEADTNFNNMIYGER